jgi:type I restriction enzyme S subunit
MRDGWVEATLREALEPIANRPNGKDYPLVLSVTEKRGIIPQTEIFNHRIATDDISKYKVLEPMDIAYNPYLLWCGAIGQWQGTEAGVVSPVYECFRVKSNCEPRYLGYIFETGILTNYFDALAIGSIVRRRRTIPSDFIAAPIQLPPLPEQKRIVDLISSVDSYIEALQQQLESAKRSRNAVLHELLTAGGDDWEESSLGRLLTLEYGKPLTDENRDGIGFPVFASAGVVGMHSEPLVSNSPVIVVGRKGTAGAVHWSSTPCFVIDTAYFVKPISDIDLRFLYLLLGFIDLKSVTAQTGVPGLNRDRAYSLKCNLPPKSKQLEVVAIVTQLDDFIDSTQGTINRSQDLRSGLLSDLLSGEHLIPSSYDKVIGAA